MTLKIWTHSTEPTIQNLYLEGVLDAVTAPELDRFVQQNLPAPTHTVILDLESLSFVSSAGLRSFAKLRKLMQSKNGTVYFVKLSPQVQKVFDIVKAVPISQVFASVAELDAYLATIQAKATEG